VIARVTWLRWLLTDFGVPMHYDGTSAISIVQDPVKHELTKHIGIDCFYVRSRRFNLQTYQDPHSSSALFSSFQTQCGPTLSLRGRERGEGGLEIYMLWIVYPL
jgi:hypothetical protein